MESSRKYKFLRDRHIKFLRRCLTILPSSSVSFDSSRATILFFALSGLDVLGAIDQVSSSMREEIIEWIYSLQITSKDGYTCGGFRGGHFISNVEKHYVIGTDASPNTNGTINPVPPAKTTENGSMNHLNDISSLNLNDKVSVHSKSANRLDNSHIAMTYSALASLIILGDDLTRVDKKAVLKHVASLQGEDGSFYSTAVEGENDLRFVYCAAVICYLLGDTDAIDKAAVIRYIKSCIGYAGAMGQGALQESHGGSTFCGIASLYLLGALESGDEECSTAIDPREMDALVRWLIMRQEDIRTNNSFIDKDDVNIAGGGLQGRPNKPADSCYTFWIGATLKLLNFSCLLDSDALREFVLTAQDPVTGGFSKHSAGSADGLHTFLGLSGMSILGLQPELLPMHPALNITHRALEHLKSLRMSDTS